jgi:hypothetical protein
MAEVSLFRGKLIVCRVGRVLPIIISVAVGLSSGLLQASAQTSSLPGKSGVGSSGAATYSVPISVPPGTAGMSPSLSLDYNSQSGASSGWLGAGLAGVGWSLSGLPAIGRCPRTVAQDGVAGAVNYDANDRFCLDGQRLVAVTGVYGADGTEYRTEIESFSKIISHGTAGTGPAWFEVRSKSGQILQFGNTTDSRILAQGKTTARSWGVNKVSDTKGNYFTVTYVNDTVNGQAYPSRIDYTANDSASLAAYNSVQFVYDTNRTDVLPIYHAGSLIKTTVRLTNVRTYAGSSLVGDYRLAYQQGGASGRSQLTSITLCDGTGNCLPATSFTWQNGTTTPTVISNVAGQNGALAGSRPYIGDFNGDGLPDMMWDDEPADRIGTNGTRVLWTSTGAGGFNVNSNFAGQNGVLTPLFQGTGGFVLYFAPLIGDFNRDGRSDVWWYLQLPLVPSPTWISAPGAGHVVGTGAVPPSSMPIAVFDVNADGRTDLVWRNSSILTVWRVNSDGTVATNDINLSTYFPGTINGGPFNGTPIASIIAAMSSLRPVDFNGDGIGDILWSTTAFNGGKFGLWLGIGDGTFMQVSGADTSVSGHHALSVDINGDGKTDILWNQFDSTSGLATGQRILWISRGDGTFEIIANPGGQNGTLAGYIPNAADLNGDGIADVLWVSVDGNGISTGSSVAWFGKGDGAFTVVQNYGGAAPVGYVPILADFNGDGKTDVLWDSRSGTDSRSTGARLLWLSDGVSPDIIKTVTNGVGATVTLTYKSLTDSAVYTKDNTAVDPVIDVQMPLQAVSRIDVSNGIGGTLATAYAYVGAKTDINGRGFLGFRQMKTTDLQTNIVQTTTYRQDYPFLFSVANESQTLASATLGATTNTYGSTSLGGTRYQVFLTESQTTKNDLDGTAVPSATTSYQYDAYNNATQITVATSDGYSKTTNNTYTNDTTNWLLGRLTAATVTAQAPQQLGQYCSVPWGGTIGNGQSVTAYSAATPSVGQACSAIAQTRTCTNGTLSGSYTQQSCTPMACTLPWGGTIASGASVAAYSAANPPVGQACSTIAETRMCSLGALSGSYTQQSCAALCALPWGGTITQGQSVTAYSVGGVPPPQVCSSVAETRTCGASGILSGSFTKQTCSVAAPVRVYLTSGSSWTVPANWNGSNNKIEVIGGGGNGGVVYGAGGGGAGGGGYSSISNLALTPGSTVSYNVGLGGTGGSSAPGGSTWFNGTGLSSASVSAQGGAGGLNNTVGPVLGGQASNGIGSTKYSGGNGGQGGYGGGGGGGSAGPHGNGGAGGNYIGGVYSGGGGGGGADGGTAGGDNNTVGTGSPFRYAFGGTGGNGFGGTGGAASSPSACNAGTNGGGGSGGYAGACGGGAGSMDIVFDSTHGSGAGGGGGGAGNIGGTTPGRPGGPGANYGGGGGGGGAINALGGAGGNGIIVITYTPSI